MAETEKGISFIIPAYNEENSITDTLNRVLAALRNCPVPTEVLLINDGSTDRTLERAMTVEGVRVINHPVNIGYGNALKTGFRQARYSWAGMVDADGSYPIEEIPNLLQYMQEGYDMVVATRSNINEIDSFRKRLFRGLFKKLVKLVNDSRIEDPNSGFRLIRRDVVLRLMPFLCGTFSFTTSLTILMSGMYYFIKYYPVQYEQRTGRSKVRHLRDSLRTFQYVMQGIIFFNPIKFFLLLSLVTILFVHIPAMVIAVFKMHTLSLYYVIFGTAVALMVGMGALGDIIRISVDRHQSE